MTKKTETSRQNGYIAYSIGQFLLHTQGDNNKQKRIKSIHFDSNLLNTEIQTGYLFSLAVHESYKDTHKIEKAINVIKHQLLPKLANEAPTVRDEVFIMLKQLQALKRYASGDTELALSQLEKIAMREDTSYREHGVLMIVKPSHELRGDILMEQHRYGEALIEYKTELLHNPYRRLSVEGLLKAAQRTGNKVEINYALSMLANQFHN